MIAYACSSWATDSRPLRPWTHSSSSQSPRPNCWGSSLIGSKWWISSISSPSPRRLSRPNSVWIVGLIWSVSTSTTLVLPERARARPSPAVIVDFPSPAPLLVTSSLRLPSAARRRTSSASESKYSSSGSSHWLDFFPAWGSDFGVMRVRSSSGAGRPRALSGAPRDHPEDWKLQDLGHVPRRLDGSPQVLPEQRETGSAHEPHDQAEGQIQGFARAHRLGAQRRRLDDVDQRLPDLAADLDLLDLGHQERVEVAIRLELTLERGVLPLPVVRVAQLVLALVDRRPEAVLAALEHR